MRDFFAMTENKATDTPVESKDPPEDMYRRIEELLFGASTPIRVNYEAVHVLNLNKLEGVLMPIFIALVAFSVASQSSPVETLESIPIAAKKDSRTEGGYQVVYLIADYGFYMNWPDDEAPELYSYEKKPAKIKSYSSVDDFLSWLSKLPESARIDQIRTCEGTKGGMPQAASDRLQAILNDRKLHLTDANEGHFTICLCEATDFRMFKTLNEAKAWFAKNKHQCHLTNRPVKTNSGGQSQKQCTGAAASN